MVTALTFAASLWAALAVSSRMAEWFGSAPILSVPGGSVSFAGHAARRYAAVRTAAHAAKQAGTHAAQHAVTHAATTLPNVAARKADDRARPRGRRL